MWELIITGCGTSHGNPAWGYPERWSTDPRDFRRRAGGMLRGPGGEVVLIDIGPDLGAQLTDPYRDWDGRSYPDRCITRTDGVLLTHDHADHCHGINELRHLNRLMDGAGIPIFGLAGHLDGLRSMFGYCFDSGGAYAQANPALSTVAVTPGEPFEVAGLTVTAITMSHGAAGITAGFRINDVAWLTDLKSIDPAGLPVLEGLDLLVLDMLREAVHPTHLCWTEAEALITRLAPKRTILTHMGHEVRVGEWVERLPDGVTMAVDGMTATFVG
ncbi:MAG: phosphoribosyl 1,2-cyclic phosphate phosphodiesterase [Myxococcota bacterium]|jgi:phosphoribosyl 1,2-cyclic phosphate phosphodiesterase